ncbi:MAG: (d)CMP kinase [Pyrodictiaceae archaeon]
MRQAKQGPTIAISGPAGSGKTTYAKMLARDLGLAYHSAGHVFREMARKAGMSLEEFNRLASSDPRIDLKIDQEVLEIARRGGVVIEGHLVAWIVWSIADVVIYVTAPLEERIRRIAARESRSIRDVARETITREQMQLERYARYYGVDITDYSIFDLVLNTAKLSINDAYTIIKETVCRIIGRKYSLDNCGGPRKDKV